MAIGKGGRIVVELDPELKQRLYQQLEEDKLTMKAWLQQQIDVYLHDRRQRGFRFDDPPDHDLAH